MTDESNNELWITLWNCVKLENPTAALESNRFLNCRGTFCVNGDMPPQETIIF
jgi:hypothetical protein